MTAKTIRLVLLTGCVLLIGHVGPDVADAQSSRLRLEADPQYSAGGTEQCLSCHGGETMTIVGDTHHGNLENPHSPYSQQGCESCHGPGGMHSSRAGGGAGFPSLLSFEGTDDITEQNAVCMNCHAETLGELAGFAWAGSLHDNAGMSCQDCHQSHSTDRPMEDTKSQRKNCSGCHRRHIRRHPTFEDVGIVFDEVPCSDCHDVHQLEAKQEKESAAVPARSTGG